VVIFLGVPMHIKNWKTYQHYKDRSPPWIKLYHSILDDIEWHKLDPLASKVLVMCWLLASEDAKGEGNLPDIEEMAFRFRIDIKKLKTAISSLNHWIKDDNSNVLADCKQVAMLETETETYKEEKETDKPLSKKVSEIYEHYKTVFKKPKSRLGQKKITLIQKALLRGHTSDDLFKAIEAMSIDDWEDRHKFNDLSYAIGEIKGIDMVEKWADYKPKGSNKKNRYDTKGKDYGPAGHFSI